MRSQSQPSLSRMEGMSYVPTLYSSDTGTGSFEVRSHHIHFSQFGAVFLNYPSEGSR